MLYFLSLQYTGNYICSKWSVTNNIKQWKREYLKSILQYPKEALIWIAIEKIVYIATSNCVT